MKMNRVIMMWSILAVPAMALLGGTKAHGQTIATNVPPSADMVLIKAGSNNGTDPDAGAYSLTVTNSFYMDKYEVTKALWDQVSAWGGAHGYGFSSGSGKATNHPVQSVAWYDAVKWCNARSEMEGRPAFYRRGSEVYRNGTSVPDEVPAQLSVPGYRLPTGLEWEYAARGGQKGKRFPWGDTIDHDKANYFGHSSFLAYDKGYAGGDKRYASGEEPFTAPVGSFPPNGYGLFDMVGNVWEWCWEWSPAAPNAHRMIRGGAWSYSADYGRSASGSNNMYPEYNSHTMGFRCVMATGK